MKRKNNNKWYLFLKYTKLFLKILTTALILAKDAIKRILTNRWMVGFLCFILGLTIFLSLFNQAGILGDKILSISIYFLGMTNSILPSLLFLTSLVLFFSHYQKRALYLFLAFFIFLLSTSGIWGENGGLLGKSVQNLFEKLVGKILSKIFFFLGVIFSLFIFFILLKIERKEGEPRSITIKRFLIPLFKEKEVEKEKKMVLKVQVVEKESEKDKQPLKIEYQPPPITFLEKDHGKPLAGDIKENCLIIKKTLENFGIEVEMGEVHIGPTVTQYTLKPAEGIKLSRITALANDLSLALASHPIRIEAPIPGKSLVGIEVPNKTRTLVRLRDLISNPEFQKMPSPLAFVLGRNVSGDPVFADINRMPHLLVAGATGTGKTMFLNSLILSLVYRNSPQILNFVLIDPKRVEFPVYETLPHLLSPVIFDVSKVVSVLDWLVLEMERRFEILAREKTRDIIAFNEIAIKRGTRLMPLIVVIIDELADIMAAKGREVENRIVRLAQLARAVGIHLILATQRPSVEVLTGLIKANITSRIAFQVASQFDSRTILDMAGAEKLLGRGDLLFLSSESPLPRRVQGVYIEEKEIKRVVEWFGSQNQKPEFDPNLLFALEREEQTKEGEEILEEEDPLYEDAKRVVIEAKRASASLLQRRLKIGYARAARLLDILEKRGIVGPAQGAKPRQVYFNDNDEWEKV